MCEREDMSENAKKRKREETVRQSNEDMTEICVGGVLFYCLIRDGKYFAESSELRAFLELLFPSIAGDIYDEGKWKRFCKGSTALENFEYCRDVTRKGMRYVTLKSGKFSFSRHTRYNWLMKLLCAARFFSVMDLVWFITYNMSSGEKDNLKCLLTLEQHLWDFLMCQFHHLWQVTLLIILIKSDIYNFHIVQLCQK